MIVPLKRVSQSTPYVASKESLQIAPFCAGQRSSLQLGMLSGAGVGKLGGDQLVVGMVYVNVPENENGSKATLLAATGARVTWEPPMLVAATRIREWLYVRMIVLTWGNEPLTSRTSCPDGEQCHDQGCRRHLCRHKLQVSYESVRWLLELQVRHRSNETRWMFTRAVRGMWPYARPHVSLGHPQTR